MIRKILLVVLIVIVMLVAAGAIYVGARQNLTFDAPYPEAAASTDSAVVARGRYLVRDLLNCAQCHGDTSRVAAW